jgi:hypothetical protein
MINNNPDGVGVAWNDGKTVHFIKGLSTADEVLRLYNENRVKLRQFVFHSRIATSGGISAEKCHPFVMSDKNTKLDKTKGDAPCVCFHNGVLPIAIEKGLNDTQTFIKTHLFPLWECNKRALLRGRFDNLISRAVSGSRFVIMGAKGLRLFGNWTKDNGIFYSNTGYKPVPRWERWGRWDTHSTAEDAYIPVKYRLSNLISEGELEW